MEKKELPLIKKEKRKMTNISKRKLLFTALLIAFLSISSAYAVLIPTVHAAELTSLQKGEIISKDVVGLDLTKYAKTAQESPPDSYLGVLPQENIRYTLSSNGSKVDIRYTFANGNLRILHVLETKGSPQMTKTAASTLANAKDFLSSYQL